MQIPSRYTIAIHTLELIDYFGEDNKITSDFIAGSVGVNPVIIRNTIQQLKNAGLIEVKRGSGGATLSRPLSEISMLDVYEAIEPTEEEGLFHFHEKPNKKCPVGGNIHKALNKRLHEAEDAMKDKLSGMYLSDIAKDIEKEAAKQ